ncbi:MAG TPA: pirin family protein [Desulfobacterales bacterium]
MSDLIPGTETAQKCYAHTSDSETAVALPARKARLGKGLEIYRALPLKELKMIGPWCFVDHFGPLQVAQGAGLRIGPHPHIGLQTVTWLLAGELLHRDSLGFVQRILPGQLNLMTSGGGISHSEESPAEHVGPLHGVQLWLALPEVERHRHPGFDHYAVLPVIEKTGMRICLLAGDAMGQHSPARVFSPMVALDIELIDTGTGQIGLNPEYEHGLLVLEGHVTTADKLLGVGTLLYLPRGRRHLDLDNPMPARVLLIGGQPFSETILMWWNFVGRTKEEIASARDDWEKGTRFGIVHGCNGARIAAPEFTYRIKSGE